MKARIPNAWQNLPYKQRERLTEYMKKVAFEAAQTQLNNEKQYKLVAEHKQDEYLDKRMAEIFKKDGFPQDFIDDLIGKVEVVDK